MAWAQQSTPTPSPKELWKAYPLRPQQAPATATPSAESGAAPSATASASGDSDGGVPWIVVILLAAPPVFATGLLVGHRRNRIAEQSSSAATEPREPAAPKRFQWRDYPEPARPAPPPPPVPGQRGPEFEAALEQERAAAPRTKEKEPH